MTYLTQCIFKRFSDHLLIERLGILPLLSVVQLSPNQFQFSFNFHPSFFEDLPELAEVCLMSGVESFLVNLTLFEKSAKACCIAQPIEANDDLECQLIFLSKLLEVEFEEIYLPPYSPTSLKEVGTWQ